MIDCGYLLMQFLLYEYYYFAVFALLSHLDK